MKKKLLNFFGKLEKNATYSRANAKVIITLLFSLVFFYQFQDKINQVPDLSYSIILIMVLFVALNIETLYPPKDNLQAIYQDAMHVGMFYIIAILVIFVISTLHTLNLIDTEGKITLASIGSGLIAMVGLYFFYRRIQNQDKQVRFQGEQIQIQINQRVDERFNSAINLLGSSETSARTGAVYALHELALEEEKYRQQIVQILCSHIRSKTNEQEYKKNHEERPSNEIQTTLNLLFKEKERGLYAQDFAKVAGFPRADLSHAYLVKADFRYAQCQGAGFGGAQCQRASFRGAQCQEAYFWGAQCQGAYFCGAQCQGAYFSKAQRQEAHFSKAQYQEAGF